MRSRWRAVRISDMTGIVCVMLLVCAAFPCEGSVVGSVRYAAGETVPASMLEGGSFLTEDVAFSDSLLERELVRLDSLYFSYGLLAATMTIDTVRSAGRVDIEVDISEGERTRVGAVSVSGSAFYTTDEIIDRLGVRTGDPFDPVALEGSLRRLLVTYNDAGFPYAQVWLTGFVYRPESNRAELSFSIFEGDRAAIEHLFFEGLGKTDTTTALRISRLREGAVYNERAIQRARSYLRSSGLFESVGGVEVRRGKDGAVDVVIPLKEIERYNRFQGAFGFSRKDDGEYVLNGSAEVELRNIAGTGRSAMFSWLNDGEKYSEVDVRYGEPFLFSSPVHLDVEMRQIVQDTVFTWHSGGLYFTVPLGPDYSIVAGAAGDRNVPGSGELLRSIRQRYRLGFERWGGNLLNVRAHIDGAYKRNYLRGDRAEHEGQILYRLEAAVDITTFHNQSFFCRLVSEAVFSSRVIPAAERFPLGGAKTLRGYRENQFRGERIIYTNFEYRFGQEGRLFVFDDVGWFYRDEDGWTVKNGAGFGLRSASALGIIELSFGVGDRLSLEGTRIHISLQERF